MSKSKKIILSAFLLALFIIKPLFLSILRRTSEMEKTLRARGYEE